jgi:hypothetical protein
VLTAAHKRYEHVVEKKEADLKHVAEVLAQLEREYRRAEPFDEGRALAMLRYDVNNRKHSIYFLSLSRDRKSAGRGPGQSWSDSGQEIQMRVACESFDLVGKAYSELLAWHPEASAR